MEAGDGLKHLDARPAIFLRRRKLSYSTIEKLWGYFFIIPFLLLFLLFHIIPAGLAVWLSVVHWKPLGGSQWIGLLNYSRIFANDAFWSAMKNTFLYVFMVVPIGMALSFLTAVLIFSLRYNSLRQFFEAAFYLPGVISGLAIAIIWRFIFDYEVGLLNYVLSVFHAQPVNWLGNIHTALPSLAGMALSGGGGASIIIFVAALGGIPTEFYDAATIDGAGAWRKIWSITLPLLVPAMLYVLVVNTIGAFQVFIPVYILTHGGPANSTLTIGYFIYRQVFYYGDLGVAAAAGLILLLVTVGFTIAQFHRFSQVVEY